MPNHVTNAIKFANKEDFELARTKLLDKEGHVDFSLLVPVPLNIYLGNTSRVDEQDFGKFNWHDWNVSNWGTKWNAYDSEIEEDDRIIRFDTAWSPPYPIIVALSRFVPNFTHYYIEEIYESWGQEEWREGTRVAYWKNDPKIYETIFEFVNGTGAWDEYSEEANAEGYVWPPDLEYHTPTIKLAYDTKKQETA